MITQSSAIYGMFLTIITIHHHTQCYNKAFLSDLGVSGVRSMCLLLSHSLTDTPFADLTDVTLADGDTNPMLTDDANRTFQGNVAMQVTQPGC